MPLDLRASTNWRTEKARSLTREVVGRSLAVGKAGPDSLTGGGSWTEREKRREQPGESQRLHRIWSSGLVATASMRLQLAEFSTLPWSEETDPPVICALEFCRFDSIWHYSLSFVAQNAACAASTSPWQAGPNLPRCWHQQSSFFLASSARRRRNSASCSARLTSNS